MFRVLDYLLIIAAPFVGSFLGLVIVRLPEGRPILFGRSVCECGKKMLALRDLFPIVSWISTGGRCRTCAKSLGFFYPAIETAALLVAVWSIAVLPSGMNWVGASFGWMLLTLGWIDQRTFILPDALTMPLMAAGLVVAAVTYRWNSINYLFGAAVGYLSLYLVSWCYRQLRGSEGLGQGDAKLFAAIGAWVGWSGLPTVLLFATLGGLITVSVQGMGSAVVLRERKLQFGPYMCASGWIVWLYSAT